MTQLWIERIKDYRASGESVAAWCQRHQVTQHQLWYRMRKLRKAEQQTLSAEKPQWVSLRLVPVQTTLTFAYSGRIRPCIPVESVHAFRRKSTAGSGDNRPPIPVQIDRLKT